MCCNLTFLAYFKVRISFLLFGNQILLGLKVGRIREIFPVSKLQRQFYKLNSSNFLHKDKLNAEMIKLNSSIEKAEDVKHFK